MDGVDAVDGGYALSEYASTGEACRHLLGGGSKTERPAGGHKLLLYGKRAYSCLCTFPVSSACVVVSKETTSVQVEPPDRTPCVSLLSLYPSPVSFEEKEARGALPALPGATRGACKRLYV